MRPARKRGYLHRIEVEHALYLAAANHERIERVLTETLRAQANGLEVIDTALSDLTFEIGAGFSALADGLDSVAWQVERLDATARRGFYQLHCDVSEIGATLNDVLLLLYDRASYERELVDRAAAAKERKDRLTASGEYAAGLKLTRDALYDSDLARARAMLNEALVVFGRACKHSEFELNAHFQLGYLAQQHSRDLERAHEHFTAALGPQFSPHFTRTTRHLAHVEFLTGRADAAFSRMRELVRLDESITAFAEDLRIASEATWEGESCIVALETALARHSTLLAPCSLLRDVQRELREERRYSATERFRQSFEGIAAELRTIRPDVRIYYEAARYASATHQSELAVEWLRRCLESQPTWKAQRVFLIEARSDPAFDND